MLAKNTDSLRNQTDVDFEQWYIWDDVGRGVAWAEKELSQCKFPMLGKYVLVLDDDDMMACDTAIEDWKAVAEEQNYPRVIFHRGDFLHKGILPKDEWWEKKPQRGNIGAFSFIVERKLWQRHIQVWGCVKYGGDWPFIRAVWHDNPTMYWLDKVMCKCQRAGSVGEPE